MFNPALATAVVDSARAAGCTISIDLASFEVVNVARDWIKRQIDTGVHVVFANERGDRSGVRREPRGKNQRVFEAEPSGERAFEALVAHTIACDEAGSARTKLAFAAFDRVSEAQVVV